MTPAAVELERSPQEDGILKRRVQGLLLFRLLLALLFLGVTIVVQTRRDQELLSAQLQPLYVLACILFVFTIVAAWSLGRVGDMRRFCYVQLVFDVGAVTFLIYLSGGLESPFSLFYMLVIIGAALLLNRRGSLLIASLSSLAYGLLLDLQYFGWVVPLQIVARSTNTPDSGTYFHSILMNLAGFYLVAYISGSLAEELQRSSRRERAQRRDLHRLELLHWNIVQSMNSGLMMIDPSGIIRFANLAASEILDMPGSVIEGRDIRTLFPALDMTDWSNLQGHEGSRDPSEVVARREFSYQKPSGAELCLGYTVSVLQKDREGRLGWVLIFQDLTKLKAMQEHVKRLEKVALAGHIASEIAHEIKNPLAAMSGAVQMLRDEVSLDSVHARLMNIVEREIQRINELVVDFLWLARGAKKPEVVASIPLCGAIQETVALLQAEKRGGIAEKVTTQFDGTPVVTMDPQHFRQILWNLLLNGLEAISGGGSLRIRVCESPGNGTGQREARIDIQDTGCGIPPEHRDRVFEPFFTTKQGGTGLGLSIVYQLVENAGGRITVSHLEPQGTCFSLFFPLAPQ